MAIENLVYYAVDGFLFGAVAGYAVKEVMKIAAIVIGLFVAGLSYLKAILSINLEKERLWTNPTFSIR